MLEQASSKSLFRLTQDAYSAKKKAYLASYDRKTEMLVGGVIVCKFCHEPKLADFPERPFIIRCKCSCEIRAWEKSRRGNDQPRQTESPVAGLPAEFRTALFSTLDLRAATDTQVETAERCEAFVQNFSRVWDLGRGIWLYGNRGAGKTYLGACILHGLEKVGRTPIYAAVEDVTAAVTASYKNAGMSAAQVIAALAGCECLILDRMDDLVASKRASERESTRAICRLIRMRYENRRPTVYIARKPISEYFGSGLDEDVLDMLRGRSVELNYSGKNRRLEE